MNNLILIGGGGHCKSVIDSALRMKVFNKIVIVDPNMQVGTHIMGCEVVGEDNDLERLRCSGYNQAFITIGSVGINPIREKLAETIEQLGYAFPVIVDPSAIIAETVNVGKGTFVGKNTVINACSRIGSHCIINTGAIIEHECVVEDYSHISVGAILCGEVNVGKNCLIGAGSTIIQSLKVGDNVVVGANSIVLSDVGDNMKGMGVIDFSGG